MVRTPRWAITPKDHPSMETHCTQAAKPTARLQYGDLPPDAMDAAPQ